CTRVATTTGFLCATPRSYLITPKHGMKPPVPTAQYATPLTRYEGAQVSPICQPWAKAKCVSVLSTKGEWNFHSKNSGSMMCVVGNWALPISMYPSEG